MDSSHVPRRLHYLKCSRCRKDKKKCLPFDRSWPRDKCDRCTRYHYACSASMTASQDNRLQQQQGVARSMPPVPGPQQPFGVQSVIPNSDQCNGIQPDGNRSWPKCAPYFSTLIEAPWGISVAESSLFIANLVLSVGKAESDRVYYTLKRRLYMIEVGRKYTKLVQEGISDGMGLEESRAFASRMLIFEVGNEGKSQGAAEFVRTFDHIITMALRWHSLLVAVGVPEVFLINDDMDEIEPCEDMPLPEVEEVSDEEWPSLLGKLLSPVLGLKDTCLRLSGVADMIQRLKESEKSELKEVLADSIEKWVKDVLGDRKSLPGYASDEFDDDDDDDSMADTD